MKNKLIFTPISEFKKHYPTVGDVETLMFIFVEMFNEHEGQTHHLGYIDETDYDSLTEDNTIEVELYIAKITHYCLIDPSDFIFDAKKPKEVTDENI